MVLIRPAFSFKDKKRHDPLNPTLQNMIGIDYRYAGRLNESIEAFREVWQLSPGYISAHYQIGVSMLLKRDYVVALAGIPSQDRPRSGAAGPDRVRGESPAELRHFWCAEEAIATLKARRADCAGLQAGMTTG